MLKLRSRQQRGHVQISWLNSWHTFSFGEYRDEQHMGWGPLRVINDDTVAAQGGFAPHSHRDMEIISYVLSGSLQHRDSLGNGSMITPGEIQCMRAGSGISHSEYNPSPDTPVHFLQIWVIPHTQGLAPGYQQQGIPADLVAGRFGLIAGPAGSGALVDIAQQAWLLAAKLTAGQGCALPAVAGRGYLHLATGAASLGDLALQAGDGVYVQAETGLVLQASADSEALFFDLGN